MNNSLIQSIQEYTSSLEQHIAALEKRVLQLEEQLKTLQDNENNYTTTIHQLQGVIEQINQTLQANATQQMNQEPEIEVELIVSDTESEEETIETQENTPIEKDIEETSTHTTIASQEDILPIVDNEEEEMQTPQEVVPVEETTIEEKTIVETGVEKTQEEIKEAVVPEVVAQEAAAPEKPKEKETKTTFYPTQTTLFGSSVDDIRQAISLGDRFLFQRELFGGNGELMQKTLDILNQKHDFDDALAYINKNFEWNQDSSTYELFINVLHRRF